MLTRAASNACAFAFPDKRMAEAQASGRRLTNRILERRIRLLLAAALAGLVAASGQAPFGFYPLAIIGLLCGYALISATQTAWRAALAGWALGTGYFGGTLAWIVQPFLVDAARYGWMAPFAVFFMAAGLALFWALGTGLARRFAPRAGFFLIWAAFMTAVELLRGVVFTGFPWGGLGAFWVDTPLLGLAGLIGANGLAFLTFLFVASLGHALTCARKARGVVIVTAALLVALLWGQFMATRPVSDRANPVALRLVQPNAPQELKWDPRYALSFLDRAMDLTAMPPAAGAGQPDLVIWPETSVPYLLRDAGPSLREIALRAAPGRVILGIQRSEQPRYYNSLVVLDQAGAVSQTYDKAHLVPFGEYTPGGSLLYRFGIKGFAAQYGNGFSAGPGPQVLDLGEAGKILPLICYEAIFPGDLRRAPERADWIVQITNDAWFGTFSGPQQHLAQARLRAVEQGLPFVRAANTGISAVIDAHGQIVASLGLGETGFLDADLPGARPMPLYARFGDGLLILLLLGITFQHVARSGRNND